MSSTQDPSRGWIREALVTYEGPLLRYAARLSQGDMERARDAVQDTFIRLCDQDRGKVEGYLAAWLYRVCRNRVLELRRKEDRMGPLDDKMLAVNPVDGPDPADRVQQRDSLAAVMGLLGGLPPNQQEVVRLKFQSELSYKEISDVTGLTVSNVGFLLHTALRRLREGFRQLEAQGQETTP
jgi:RNA polymerase sigma-70 factor (ECF subfamily)